MPAIARIAFSVIGATALVWLAFGNAGALALWFGFPAHLARVWPQITWNPDLLVPAAVAFTLAVAIGHGLLRGPLGRRGIRWRFDHTLALAAFLPLLFATAFLVPGILLHAGLLIEHVRIANHRVPPSEDSCPGRGKEAIIGLEHQNRKDRAVMLVGDESRGDGTDAFSAAAIRCPPRSVLGLVCQQFVAKHRVVSPPLVTTTVHHHLRLVVVPVKITVSRVEIKLCGNDSPSHRTDAGCR